MRALAGITLGLCLAAPLFAQVVKRPQERPVPQVDDHLPDRPKFVSSNGRLNHAEASAIRRQIQACWMVKEDMPSVTLGFSLTPAGKPQQASFREVRHDAASQTSVDQAFAAAKRAVLRCGRDGYTLPVEKYEQWRDIELTFDPERTILK